MLCLFKNSKLSLPFHLFALLSSWGGVIYWLNFSLIEKSFLANVFSGQALFIDLIFALPIVLIFAIVIYAFVYWLIKFCVIIFLPHTIIQIQTENELDDMLDPELGKDYWKKDPKLEDAALAKQADKKSDKII